MEYFVNKYLKVKELIIDSKILYKEYDLYVCSLVILFVTFPYRRLFKFNNCDYYSLYCDITNLTFLFLSGTRWGDAWGIQQRILWARRSRRESVRILWSASTGRQVPLGLQIRRGWAKLPTDRNEIRGPHVHDWSSSGCRARCGG